MLTRHVFYLLATIGCTGCGNLLSADFDDHPEGSLNDQVVMLPGPPDGDRMIVENLVQVADSADSGDQSLYIFRNVLTNQTGNHSEVFFDPVAAGDAASLYFSWEGSIGGLSSPGTDTPVVAVKLRDLAGPDQPNLFSKLIIRFGPGKITATTPPGEEVSIGNGVGSSHGVILRIDPATKLYAFAISGPGVSPGGGFTHTGTLASGVSVDPDNIGITLTFADEIDAAGSSYAVNNMTVSKRAPR